MPGNFTTPGLLGVGYTVDVYTILLYAEVMVGALVYANFISQL